MRSGERLALLLVASVLAISALTVAQTATSSLRGTVTDPKGAVLQGAVVTLSNTATGFLRTTKSGNDGTYQFLEVPPATYVMTVAATGFATVKQDRVTLQVSQPATLDVGMQVRGTTEMVEVSSEAPLVNTTDATIGNAFGSRQIIDLPFEGRNPVEMLSLQPGVTYTGPQSNTTDNMVDTRNGSVNGGRSDQANVTLDGIDNNDQNNGFAFVGALRSTLDSVEEFRVTTSNSNADAGRSSGAQVSLITKSGTNSWHGSAYEYNRSNIGEANDWFNEASQVSSGLPNKPPHLVRNTFGASLGGAIKKDKLFFFANWEAQRTHESTQTTRVVPTDSLRAGAVSYLCDVGTDPNCVTSNTGSGGANVSIGPTPGVDSSQFLLATIQNQTLALLDPNCTTTCPLGPGANPALIDPTNGIFNAYPHSNTNAAVGADGYNFGGYTFSAATPVTLNTYIAKIDYNINGNNRIFVRGNLQGDKSAFAPQFPGLPPSFSDVVTSKGLAAGYTAVITPMLINNFRYGLVRQSLDEVGSGNKTFITLRGLNSPHGESYDSHAVAVPVHNFVDDLSWTKGKHTLQLGANFRMIGDIRDSTLTSFSSGSTNASWLDVSAIANKGHSLDPAAGQFAGYSLPAVDGGFRNSYDYPVMALAGIVSEVDTRYNFTTKGDTLPEGAPNLRHFVAHEFETYAQDSWRVKPNLTVTFGLRWALLQPPYEKNGVQVAPTISLNNWFSRRQQTQLAGGAFNDPIQFGLAGKANGKQPYWGYDYKDFAPRFAIAYSPASDGGFLGRLFGGPGKSSIRMGVGMYYDHFGEGIVNTFDQDGSFGLSTLLTNTGGVQDVDTAPRLAVNGLYTLPPSLITPSPGAVFPVTFPTDNFAVQWGLDDKLKTPYSYAFDLSFERQLPHGFVIETAYVGRIAHRLLQQEDLGQPRDIVDPASKMDYFTATRGLDNAVLSGADESAVGPIPYWENLYGATSAGPGGSAGCASGIPANPTATQNMFDLMSCGFVYNESTFQQIIDGVGGGACFPGCITLNGAVQTTPQFFAGQFASLYAWRSIGNSAYNAGQLLLKHAMSHGVQFDLNYTFSKSIDMGSDAERIGDLGGPGDQIYNAWSPQLQRAISTFDTTHQLNSNWLFELPFGRGRAFGSNVGHAVDGVLGGWQLTGLFRWTSGFPVSLGNGAAWATNWDLSGFATRIGPQPKTQTTIQADGLPNLFKNPSAVLPSYRQDFAGEVGGRNTLRGPGYVGVDMGLDKNFKITESQMLRLSWEVFNVFNSVRFDALTANTGIDQSTSFGNFTKTLTVPRKMQFAFRYSF